MLLVLLRRRRFGTVPWGDDELGLLLEHRRNKRREESSGRFFRIWLVWRRARNDQRRLHHWRRRSGNVTPCQLRRLLYWDSRRPGGRRLRRCRQLLGNGRRNTLRGIGALAASSLRWRQFLWHGGHHGRPPAAVVRGHGVNRSVKYAVQVVVHLHQPLGLDVGIGGRARRQSELRAHARHREQHAAALAPAVLLLVPGVRRAVGDVRMADHLPVLQIVHLL